MIKRIVMMQFKASELASFLALFEETKDKIRHFPGCRHLELWQDEALAERVFTYSYWDSEEQLNTYRNSPLFKSTWAQTKVLFDAKPMAWSVKMISSAD